MRLYTLNKSVKVGKDILEAGTIVGQLELADNVTDQQFADFIRSGAARPGETIPAPKAITAPAAKPEPTTTPEPKAPTKPKPKAKPKAKTTSKKKTKQK